MAPGSRPNLLFLFPDQWRWDFLGVHDGSATPYGRIPVETPHLDALAARGVRFTQCRTNSPVCSPARACLAQGLRYEDAGVPGNGQCTPTDTPSVFRMLRNQAGYHTMTCGKSDLFKPLTGDNPTGFIPLMGEYGFRDGIDHRGKGDAVQHARAGIRECYGQMLRERGLLETHLADHPKAPLQRAAYPTPLPNDAYTDDFAGQNALKLLERVPDDRPWMLWVNFPGPHDPFDPPADALAPYAGVDFPPPVDPTDEPPPHRDNHEDRRHYAGCCTNIDRWVGRILDYVAARGELERTLVVFCSDHGEMLGDHGRWAKGVPHEGSVRVPLVMAGPGLPEGERAEDLVELIDVGASLLAGAGLEPDPSMAARPVPPLGGEARRVQLSSYADWKLACDGRFKLIVRADGTRELFDLREDPAETSSFVDAHPDALERLSEAVSPFADNAR